MPKRLRGFTAGTSAAARSASSARSAASLAHGPHSRSRSPGHEDRIVSCQRSSVNTTPVPVGTARRSWSSVPIRCAARSVAGCWTRCPSYCAWDPAAGPTLCGTTSQRGRRRQAGAAGRPRPAAGLDAGVRAARVLRPARRYSAGLVLRRARPGGGRRASPAARGTGSAGCLACWPGRGVAGHAGEAVHRSGWRTAADLSHPLAYDARGGLARAVGYSDAFAFSAAFKRTRGISPSAYRRTATSPPPQPAGTPRPGIAFSSSEPCWSP